MIRCYPGLLILCSVLLACSPSQQTPATSSQANAKQSTDSSILEVVETFNVGKNVFVRAMQFDPQENQLWIGTSVGALHVALPEGNVISTQTRETGLANEYVFAIQVDREGRKWFGTNGGGVSQFKNNQWRTYFPMHGLADYWVYSFVQAANGDLWIGTWNGLSLLNPSTHEMKTYRQELVNEWVYGLAVDSKDTLWIGTEGGINAFDGKNWRVWTHADGLGAANKHNLPFSSNTGLGTRNRHDLSVLVGTESSYNPNYIFCVSVDDQDRVWAGTWGGGVAVFDGKQWSNYSQEQGLAGDIVYSMALGKNGHSWFGTNQGLSYFDGKNWHSLGKAQGLLDQHVYAVALDNQENVWVGTRHGVARVRIKSSVQ
ncbi:MAG: regulator [Gammaproteobacteria bacterium]|nr:regulator [Gammaproteobacteria bacterium]